jgi:starvation-inducible DNA-binding protein
MPPNFTVPGMSQDDAVKVIDRLQGRLVTLIDLQLTLKHIHWNVVGPAFIGVHEMLDPQVDAVRAMVDETAERIATLGGEPNGLPGNLVRSRSWDDYDIGRAMTQEHLGALDLVYDGVIGEHRQLIGELEELDQVTQDMVIGQSEQLEQFQWFVRAHLESDGGRLVTAGATTERQAAAKAGGRTSSEGTARQEKRATTSKGAKSTGNGRRASR